MCGAPRSQESGAPGGGVHHALRCVQPDELRAAADGYAFFGLDHVAQFLRSDEPVHTGVPVPEIDSEKCGLRYKADRSNRRQRAPKDRSGRTCDGRFTACVVDDSGNFASPKSSTFTLPSGRNLTLADFKSR